MRKYLFLVFFAALIVIPVIINAQNTGGDVNMSNDGGNVVFSHDKHAAKGLTCEQCHPDLYPQSTKEHKVVTMKEMASGLSCGKCHNGNPAFSVKGNCSSCHTEED